MAILVKPTTRILLILWLSLAGLAFSQERFVEKAGGFSFVPPAALSNHREAPGFKFTFHFAPPKDAFAANLNFVDEHLPVDWPTYIQKSIEAVQTVAKGEIIEKPAPFVLDSKIECIRFVYKMSATGRDTRHICFLIHVKPDLALIATYSSLPADGAAFDDAIAQSLRTFSFTAPDAPAPSATPTKP